MPARPIDASYKLLFSHPQIVAALIQGLINDPWINLIDFSTLRPLPADLVSEQLKRQHADCIWQVDAPDGLGIVLIHLEFQSSIDPTMPLRVANYSGLMLQSLLRRLKLAQRGNWPPVLSIVIYNGTKPWRLSTQLSDHIRKAPVGLLKVTPEHRFVLIDIRRQNLESADKLNNTVGLLFRFEQPDLLQGSAQRLVRLKQLHHTQHALRRDIGTWVMAVTGNHKLLAALVKEFVNPKGSSMNMEREHQNWVKMLEKETLRKVRPLILQEGRQEGRQEGLQEGRQEGRVHSLTNMWVNKFGSLGTRTQKRLQSASCEELDRWSVNMLHAQTPAEVFRTER